jgi:hypothetical protein
MAAPMLACMTHLAFASDGAVRLTPGDIAFCATAATVIPVLFIALGWTYDALPRAVTSSVASAFRRMHITDWMRLTGLAVLVAAGVISIIYGLAGEIAAIALLTGGAIDTAYENFIGSAVLWLTLAVVARPTLTLLRSSWRFARQVWTAGGASDPGEPDDGGFMP